MVPVNEVLREATNNHDRGKVLLVRTTAEKLSENSVTLIDLLVNNRYTGIVLSINRPCNELRMIFDQKGISLEKVIVICGACPNPKKEEANVVHVDSPYSLTQMSLAIVESLKLLKRETFVFIEIDGLLIHNPSKSILQFVYYLNTRMRQLNVLGILIIVDGEKMEGIKKDIVPLCDVVLSI